MAQSVITHAFETWNVQRVLDGIAARPDKVVFARVPGQDESVPVDRNEGLPPADQIQHTAAITQAGVLNENAVVYSVVLDTTVGDWDYNWIGLLDSKTNTVLMIVHVRTQQKLATRNGQQGNSLTRNLMMQFDGAAAATQINVSADTWQIDFSARLAGIDERIRIENMDRYGSSAFFGNAYQVVKDGNAYVVKAGLAYAAGLRALLSSDLKITVDALPTRVFLDVCWRGEFTQAWAVDSQIVVANSADHEIRDGVQHYLLPVADIDEHGNVTDWRKQGSLAEQNAQTLYLRKDDNLAALRDKEASRKNLGLGQLATKDQLSASDVGAWGKTEGDDRYLQKTGGALTGSLYSTVSDNYRLVQGDYGTYWRNDATRLWLLITNPKDQLGGFNSLRPFGVELKTGAVSFGHDVSVSGTLSAPAIRVGDSNHSADGNIFGSRWGNKWLWDAIIEQVNGRVDWASFNSRTQVAGGRGGWWYKDNASGLIFQGGVVNRGGGDANSVGFPLAFVRECFGVQVTLCYSDGESARNLEARDLVNTGFNILMRENEKQAYWWAVGV